MIIIKAKELDGTWAEEKVNTFSERLDTVDRMREHGCHDFVIYIINGSRVSEHREN